MMLTTANYLKRSVQRDLAPRIEEKTNFNFVSITLNLLSVQVDNYYYYST